MLSHGVEEGCDALPRDLPARGGRRVGVYCNGAEGGEVEANGTPSNTQHGSNRTQYGVGGAFAICDGLENVVIFLTTVEDGTVADLSNGESSYIR